MFTLIKHLCAAQQMITAGQLLFWYMEISMKQLVIENYEVLTQTIKFGSPSKDQQSELKTAAPLD